MSRTILVCVAWPYANSSLHLGHIAGTWLPADIFARYHRLKGNRVLMVSGSDCHGTPVTVTAEQEKKTPQEIVDFFHAEHAEGLRQLEISIDCYFRTSEVAHKKVAQDFFTTLLQKGFIDERSIEALYCPSCQRFLPDRYVEGVCPRCKSPDARGDQCDRCGTTLDPADLKNPRCRLCSSAPMARATRLHYLMLSKLSRDLAQYLDSRKGWRSTVMNFTKNWIAEGIHDRPITRDLSWGVPVPLPGHEDKCLYVWFEAVIGYLSATMEWSRRAGNPEAWREFWENAQSESYYFIGKDNTPFHTIIWPSMLFGFGGLNLPTNVPANEYLLVSGEKFSKSRGIGAKLGECLAEFQPDQIRFYLASIMPESADADFSWDGFIARNNDEFLSVIGNLVNRVLSLTARHYGRVPEAGELTAEDQAILAAAQEAGRRTGAAIERFEFKKALREVLALAQAGNQYVNAQAPWKLLKENPGRAASVLSVSARTCESLMVYLSPFAPQTAKAAWAMLGFSGDLPAGCWDKGGPRFVAGGPLGAISPLVKKIEREEVESAHAKG